MNQISKLNGLIARRDALISQNNRLQWLKDGNKNLAFFHRLHSSRKSKASIKIVQVGDSFITVDTEIGNHVGSYYKNLFSKDYNLLQDFTILQNFD